MLSIDFEVSPNFYLIFNSSTLKDRMTILVYRTPCGDCTILNIRRMQRRLEMRIDGHRQAV